MKHIADPDLGKVCEHCVELLSLQMSIDELGEAIFVTYASFEFEEEPDELILIGRELELLIHARSRAEEREKQNA